MNTKANLKKTSRKKKVYRNFTGQTLKISTLPKPDDKLDQSHPEIDRYLRLLFSTT